MIEGGSAPNVISEKCVVKLDTRYWNNEDDKYLDDGINKLAAAVWAPGVTQTIERVSHSNSMPLSDATKEPTTTPHIPPLSISNTHNPRTQTRTSILLGCTQVGLL